MFITVMSAVHALLWPVKPPLYCVMDDGYGRTDKLTDNVMIGFREPRVTTDN